MSLPAGRALWALIGVLALCLAGEWLWPDDSAAPGQAAALRIGGRAVQAKPAPERDTSDWGDTVLARPLFSISRRPPRVVASAHSEAGPSQARLAGIMITRYGRRAIFAPDGGGKQMILAEGAAVNESTISRIEPDRVTLASGAVLAPAFDKNRSGPIPTTPPFQPVGEGPPPGGFPRPGFPNMNPNFPNPNLPNPGLVPPNLPGALNGVLNGGQPPNGDDANPQAPAIQPMLPQIMRGGAIPPRRE